MSKPKEKTYYTYYSFEEWGRGYLGSRGCFGFPEEDIKYFGSFKDKTFNPTQKIILSVHKTRSEAYRTEIILQDFFEVVKNPHFVNRVKQTTTGFTTQDFKHTNESKSKIGKASSERERTLDTRRKSSESNLGQKRTEETRKKNSEAARGKKWWYNPLTRESTMSRECPGEDWKTGRPKLPPQRKEANQARSETLRGRPKSDTHKKNLSIAALKRYGEERVKPPKGLTKNVH